MKSVGPSELELFHQFVGRQLQSPATARLTPEAVLELWRQAPVDLSDPDEIPVEPDLRSTINLEGLDPSFLNELRKRELK